MMKTYWLLGSDGMCSLINTEESNTPQSRNETDKALPNSSVRLPREDLPREDLEIKGTLYFMYYET